jgi:hypothetical protein
LLLIRKLRKICHLKNGVVVQLVSTSACQAEGRGFEPRRPRIKR